MDSDNVAMWVYVIASGIGFIMFMLCLFAILTIFSVDREVTKARKLQEQLVEILTESRALLSSIDDALHK